MRYFDRDWGEFIEFALLWEGMSGEAKQMLTEMKPTGGHPRERFGEETDGLVETRMLELYKDGTRVRQHPDRRSSFSLLRAILRAPVQEQANDEDALRYLQEHFVGKERDALLPQSLVSPYPKASTQWTQLVAVVTSVSHTEGFLDAHDPTAWEGQRLPLEDSHCQGLACVERVFEGEHIAEDCRMLLRLLGLEERPRTFAELVEVFAEFGFERLGRAVRAALRYALVFPCLDPLDNALCLTLWPGVLRHLHRDRVELPSAVDSEDLVRTYDTAWGLDDVTQLLVAAADPIRLRRSDNELFAKSKQQLEDALLPQAELFTFFPAGELSADARLQLARRTAEECNWLKTSGGQGKTLVLALTDEGRDWLALSAGERLRAMMDHTIVDRGDQPSEISTYGFDPSGHHEGFVPDTHFIRSDLEKLQLIPAIQSELASLDGSALPLKPFMDACMLTGLPESLRKLWASNRLTWRFGHMSEAHCDQLWIDCLFGVLVFRLYRYGGLRVGWTKSGILTAQLTEAGRYFLGLATDFEYGGASADRPVLVQPDFEVIFLAPSAQHEAAISRFAERIGTHLGALFRITRASIHSAARAGLSAQPLLDELASAASVPLPANVVHEVNAWFAECHHLTLEPALLLHCPTPDIASRIRAVAGRHIEAATDTLLFLPDVAKRTQVIAACRKAGLFLEGGEPVKPPKAKAKRRSHRRRYW